MYKRFLKCMAAMLILTCFLCSCEENKKITFAYNLENRFYACGETVKIRVVAENVGRKIRVTGSIHNHFGVACLVNGPYEITCQQLTVSPDDTRTTFYPGQSVEINYCFSIPEDAPEGEYDLVVSLLGVSATLKDVIVVDYSASS